MASIRKPSILYVGGLDDAVNEEVLHAAFIPFGDIKTIQLPKDFRENKHRGFAFIEYELKEDAADAIENMDGAELFGRVVRCNVARAVPKMEKGKAIWTAEEWIKNEVLDGDVIEGDLVDTMDNLIPPIINIAAADD